MPPFFSQAFADLAGSHPWPLQEFWPLHALSAVLQALLPLQELIPIQWTLAAFLAAALVTDAPFMANAIAAMARPVPDTISLEMAREPSATWACKRAHGPYT